jgi:hypothetical protein
LPAATWAISPASLAEGKVVPPLPGGRELGIQGKPPGTLASQTWDGPGKAMEKDHNEAVLQKAIEPVGAAGSLNGTGSVVQGITGWDDTGPGSGKAATYEELQNQLTARGMDWHRQEKVANGVKFVCTIPNARDPAKIRTYEATAATYQAAIRAVLEQVEKEP